jgi:hypothetical protein
MLLKLTPGPPSSHPNTPQIPTALYDFPWYLYLPRPPWLTHRRRTPLLPLSFARPRDRSNRSNKASKKKKKKDEGLLRSVSGRDDQEWHLDTVTVGEYNGSASAAVPRRAAAPLGLLGLRDPPPSPVRPNTLADLRFITVILARSRLTV